MSVTFFSFFDYDKIYVNHRSSIKLGHISSCMTWGEGWGPFNPLSKLSFAALHICIPEPTWPYAILTNCNTCTVRRDLEAANLEHFLIFIIYKKLKLAAMVVHIYKFVQMHKNVLSFPAVHQVVLLSFIMFVCHSQYLKRVKNVKLRVYNLVKYQHQSVRFRINFPRIRWFITFFRNITHSCILDLRYVRFRVSHIRGFWCIFNSSADLVVCFKIENMKTDEGYIKRQSLVI